MRAGSLRKKIIIERSTDTRGDYGEEVEAWATLSTVWANIKPLTGGETVMGGQVDASITHLITVRYTDVTSEDRIKFGSRIFNITQVLDLEEKQRELKILAIEDV